MTVLLSKEIADKVHCHTKWRQLASYSATCVVTDL